MNKKLLCVLTALCLMLTAAFSAQAEETKLDGNAQLIYETIRWNVNLPKQSMVQHAEEYLFKMTKDITLHALLMEVSVSEELEMHYGTCARLVLVDLDSGEVIDYKNFDGEVVWPDSGEVTSRYDALHLLFNSYWSCVDGYNDFLMSEFEFLTPLSDEEVAAINEALKACFIR